MPINYIIDTQDISSSERNDPVLDEKIYELMTKMYGEMQNGFKEIKGDINELKEGQNRLESRVNKLETRMENEVIDKIKSLHEARQVDQETLVRIENKVDKLAETVEDHDVKIEVIRKAK